MSIAATPDGSQVWVGNGLSGSVSVISVASGKVTATIGGAPESPGTATLDGAPLGIAFVAVPSRGASGNVEGRDHLDRGWCHGEAGQAVPGRHDDLTGPAHVEPQVGRGHDLYRASRYSFDLTLTGW